MEYNKKGPQTAKVARLPAEIGVPGCVHSIKRVTLAGITEQRSVSAGVCKKIGCRPCRWRAFHMKLVYFA